MLNCYVPSPTLAYCGNTDNAALTWHSLRATDNPHARNATYRAYRVAERGELPASVDECDAYVIGGSPSGVYDDERWMRDVRAFVHATATRRDAPRIAAICFGTCDTR